MVFILYKMRLRPCQVFFAVLKLPPCPSPDARTRARRTRHYRNPRWSRGKGFILGASSSWFRSWRVAHWSHPGEDWTGRKLIRGSQTRLERKAWGV